MSDMNTSTPIREFMDFLLAMYMSFPPVIQAMMGMLLVTVVFFGLIKMIRT